MKLIYKRLCVLVCLLFCTNAAFAEIVIIVNKNNTNSIDSKSLKRIFLAKEKRFADGLEARPINQASSQSIRREFDDKYINRTSAQVKAYWAKLVFTGKGTPPLDLQSDAAVISTVETDQSAIGYIDSASVTAQVRVINLN